MNKEQTLHSFWNSFGIPAYDENSVPDSAVLPYITYEVSISDFERPIVLSASLWYKSTSWAEITNKVNSISSVIGYGGKMLVHDDGAIWIQRGTPFAQRMSDENTNIRRIYLNVNVEFISST